MYKLIALDLDGTLLKEDKTISEENYTAIQNAKEKGVQVVLATGRPIKGIEKYLKQLNLIEDNNYAVAYNGALVQSIKDKKIIAENIMNLNDFHYLYDLSQKLNVHIHICTDKAVLTPNKDISEYTVMEAFMNDVPLHYVDFDEINESTVIVKIMFIDKEEILNEVIENLPKEIHEKYTVLRSAPYFLELLNKTVNKGEGVRLLAENLGIKKHEVICVGDAGNDIHMIEYAGLGVAMGNAFPELKKIADYVTGSNEENGVAQVINKFILNDK